MSGAEQSSGGTRPGAKGLRPVEQASGASRAGLVEVGSGAGRRGNSEREQEQQDAAPKQKGTVSLDENRERRGSDADAGEQGVQASGRRGARGWRDVVFEKKGGNGCRRRASGASRSVARRRWRRAETRESLERLVEQAETRRHG
jgi:hypothetical protein